MKRINRSVRDFLKSSCTIHRILRKRIVGGVFNPPPSPLLSSLYRRDIVKLQWDVTLVRQGFIRFSALLSNFQRRFFIYFPASLTRRSVFPNFSGTSIALTREISGPSVVSIMQIHPAPAAKEETIYISRKYACHRDVNRALGQATTLQRQEESKGDRWYKGISRKL